MFDKGTHVYIPLAGGTVPGVVVGPAESGTYKNRRGVEVPTMRVPVISYRTWNGRSWHQLSHESIALLSLRETIEPGLDVSADGRPLPLAVLWANQRESLQAHLASRQTPVEPEAPRAKRVPATA